MGNSSSVNLPVMEQGGPRSKSLVGLNKCVVSLITILGFCLQLKFANSSPDYNSTLLMRLFVIDVSAYFGSIGVMILQNDHGTGTVDFRKFMNRIIIMLGTLAFTLELLILFPPFGWLVLFIWSICFVSVASKSYQYLKTLCESGVSALVLAIGELKEKLIVMSGDLMESFTVAGIVRASERLKELIIRICRWTEHEAQNQNQIINELPV